MTYVTQATMKVLYGQASACAFPDCGIGLVFVDDERGVETPVGEMAHIRSPKANGPRHDPSFPSDRIHKASNLLLLCGSHHHVVDCNDSVYTIEELEEWRGRQMTGDGWSLTDLQAELEAQRLEAAAHSAAALDVMTRTAADTYRSRNRPDLAWELRHPGFDNWEVVVVHRGPEGLDSVTFKITDRPDAVHSLTELNTKRARVLATIVTFAPVPVASVLRVRLATEPKAGGPLVLRARCQRDEITWDVVGTLTVPNLFGPATASIDDQRENIYRPEARLDL